MTIELTEHERSMLHLCLALERDRLQDRLLDIARWDDEDRHKQKHLDLCNKRLPVVLALIEKVKG